MVHRRLLGLVTLALVAVVAIPSPARADDGRRPEDRSCQSWRRSCEDECERDDDEDDRDEAMEAEAAGTGGIARRVAVALRTAEDDAKRLVREGAAERRRRADVQSEPPCAPAPVIPEAPLGVLLPVAGAAVLGAAVAIQRRRRTDASSFA